MKVAKVNINAEVPYCSICGAVIPEWGPNAINIFEGNINYCYFCGHPIEWIEEPLGPTPLSFKNEKEYSIWLNNNTHFIPQAGKVYYVKIMDIDKSFLKIGNSLDFFSELPEVRNYEY